MPELSPLPQAPKAPEPTPAPVTPPAAVGFPSPTNPALPKPITPKPAIKPPKPSKLAPAPTPPRKQSPLGFYPGLEDSLRHLKQEKVSPEQLIGHLADYEGTGYARQPPKFTEKEPPPLGSPHKIGDYHPGWQQVHPKAWHNPKGQAAIHGFHDWLKGQQQVTKKQVEDFFADKHPELEEHSQVNMKTPNKWRVYDSGSSEHFDSEEDAESAREAWIETQVDTAMEYYEGRSLSVLEVEPDDEDDAKVWVLKDEYGDLLDEFETEEEAEARAEELQQEHRDDYEYEAKRAAEDDVTIQEIESDQQAGTHFDDYVLPGPAEGYDEMHIAAPGVRGQQKPLLKAEDFTAIENPGGNVYIVNNQQGTTVQTYPDAAAGISPDRWVNAYLTIQNKRIAAENARLAKWEDGHADFSHVENPVVRARFNTRTDAEGKKMLFLEELQGPQDANQKNMPEWLRERIYDIGLKRMLRKAADEGYERIGWTTGDQQADRYNLRKHVDRINWEPPKSKEGTGSLTGWKDGEAVIRNYLAQEQLPEYVGKELAERIMASQSATTGIYSVEGQDLEIGGHGLKNLYDRVLPAKAAKLLKRAGAKVGTNQVEVDAKPEWQIKTGGPGYRLVDQNDRELQIFQSAEESRAFMQAHKDKFTSKPTYETVHSIDLTPELRALIQEGFAMYRKPDRPLCFAMDQPRAKAGGVSIEGKRYLGGQFVPEGDATHLDDIERDLSAHDAVDQMTPADMLRAAQRYEHAKADYGDFMSEHLGDRTKEYLGGPKRPGQASSLAWMVAHWRQESRRKPVANEAKPA